MAGDTGTSACRSRNDTTPTGMFTAKKPRHDQIDASPPATSGPIALPTPPAAPQRPIANARRDGVEHHVDHRQRRREAARRCDALQRPAGQQHAERAGDRADGRRGREQHDAEEKEPPGADAVRDPADEDQRRGEPEGGDAHDGTERAARYTQVGADLGQEHGDAVEVHRQCDQWQAQGGEREPRSWSTSGRSARRTIPAVTAGRFSDDDGFDFAVRCLLNGVPYRMADPQETIATAAAVTPGDSDGWYTALTDLGARSEAVARGAATGPAMG